MDKNCMTIDLKGYIREMGASVLEFAATSRLLPFAFPCGSIIPGDIVIYVNTNPTGRIELNQYSLCLPSAGNRLQEPLICVRIVK